MSNFQQVLIGGYPGGGLTTDRKPMMLAKEAFSKLDNAYVFRERTKKRDGSPLIGRLQRLITITPPNNTNNLLMGLEATASLVPGSINVTGSGGVTWTDPAGDGVLVPSIVTPNGTVNYATGVITGPTPPNTGTFQYYPGLPVMGILKRDVATIGIDSTIFFDTVYAYQYVNGFQELVPGTIWSGSNTDFFWAANFQGVTPDIRLFFVTNNNITAGAATPYDPPRYYNSLTSSWTDLKPLVTATTTLFQARILIPYYGRLLALNVWEGLTAGGVSGATNFYARCVFSQIGDPTDQVNGWRRDIFGRGGFLDAPTNEAIVGAAFFRNTLIVFFEYSTWQLRYLGEYGLPFIFERISSDFGAISTYSPIVLIRES